MTSLIFLHLEKILKYGKYSIEFSKNKRIVGFLQSFFV